MTGLHFIGLILIVVDVIGQDTNYNCNQRPPFTSDVKSCCKRPVINIDNYKNECYNSTVSTRFGWKTDDHQAFMNPCAIECIYTQAGALSNGRFNLPKLNTFSKEVIPNNADIANIFFTGMQKCGPETQKQMQEFEARRPLDSQGKPILYPGPQPQCSPFAVLVTFCALRHLFINCPANSWTSSEMCNQARDYVTNCEPMQFGGPANNRNKV